MHVAERCSQQVAAVLAGAQGVDSLSEVLRGGVQVGTSLGLYAIFLATDDADLYLKDDVGSVCLGQQFLGDFQVLVDRHCGTVPHVRLEERKLATIHALLGDSDQGADVLVKDFLLAVVGVQCNVDVVVLCSLMSESSEGAGASHLVLNGQAGTKFGTTSGELDDAV